MDSPLPSLFVAYKEILIIPLIDEWKQEDGKPVEHR